MKTKTMAAVVLTAALFSAGAAKAADFSADVVSKSGGAVFQGKMYSSGEKTRMEAGPAVTITRTDRKAVYVLMPQQKMYMEQPFDPNKMVGSSDRVPGEENREPLGEETVNGVQAQKYRITYAVNGQKNVVHQWLAKDNNVPVRTAAEDGSWSMDLKNINTGPVSPDLFDIPAGYQKLPMGIPGMGGIGNTQDVRDMENMTDSGPASE